MIDSMSGDSGHDTLGLELFDEDVMTKVWANEKKHMQWVTLSFRLNQVLNSVLNQTSV